MKKTMNLTSGGITLGIGLALLMVLGAGVEGPVHAADLPLTIDPSNPRYYRGLDGQPVLFLSRGDNSVGFTGYTTADWHWYIDQVAANGLNLIKVIGMYTEDYDDPAKNRITPYQRTGSGITTFGNPRWNLDQWNETFFTVLGDMVAYAQTKKVYVQVQIFNHISLETGSGPNRWNGCPFNPNNNINGTGAYGFPGNGGNGAPVFYNSLNNTALVGGKRLLTRQEALFDRIVNATKAYPNVLYELGLEVTPGTAWARHWESRLNTIAPGKLLIVDIKAYTGDRSFFDGYTTHKVSTLDDSVPEELYATGKMAIEDTDFLCDWAGSDYTKLRNAVWPAVLSGVHFTDFRCTEFLVTGLGGASRAWRDPDATRQMSYVRKLVATKALPFVSMSPTDDLGTNGVEVLSGQNTYVAYTRGGGFSLTLPSGTYVTQWYNPRSGEFGSSTTITHGGGARAFTPSSGDWVLYVNKQPVVTLTTPDATATELNRTTGSFRITRSLCAGQPALTVSFSRSGSAAQSDFDPNPFGTGRTIAAGACSVTFMVTPVNDTTNEVDETVRLTLTTGSGYTVGSPSAATVTIVDND